MDLAVRGIDADIRWNIEGSFYKDGPKDLRFDYVLANPPCNVSDWGGDRLREDGFSRSFARSWVAVHRGGLGARR